jgi:hypothetical protein
LLQTGCLDGRVFDRQAAGDFGRTAAVDDAVVADEVADDAEGVVEGALGFVDELVNGGLVLSPVCWVWGWGSGLTILLLPLTKMVTARVLAHSSMTSIFSRVVPKVISRTRPAVPSFSGFRSSNRGTMRPLVAMAMSSISGPPTHLTAGRLFWRSRWLASSSKPHWQMARLAPASFIC